MRKALGVLIGALVFALFIFLSVKYVANASWKNCFPYLVFWSLIGALIGYVFAFEKLDLFKKKGPRIGAFVLGSLNLLITLSSIERGAGGMILTFYLNTPASGLAQLYISNPSLDYIFYIYILAGILIWGAMGAAIGSIIQNMDKRMSNL